MEEINARQIVNYWLKTSEHDLDTMRGLLKINRYSDALFFGHIVLEKILKAHVVNNTKTHAPHTHDLVRLAKMTGHNLNEDELKLLFQVNDFNIRSRYPEWKMNFYKICTKKYTSEFIERIEKLYKKLCQKLKPKK